MRRGDEARELDLVERPGAEEALVEVAAPVGEQGQLAGALDAFDDHLQVELAGQAIIALTTIRSRRRRRCRRSARGRSSGCRAAGWSDRRGWHSRCRNRRPRSARPRPAGWPAARRSRRCRRAGAFGDFDRDPLRDRGRRRRSRRAAIAHSRPGKILRQQVDRQVQPLRAARPGRGDAQRLALDQPRQPLGEAGRGGAREQLLGRCRAVPARQRLGADDGAADRVDLRLEEDRRCARGR